jgi:hypothetical protein
MECKMAESKSAKDKAQEEDIKFSREELLDDDLRVADEAREKRNKPMPENFRDDPSKLYGWPVHEGRLPAVMPADKPSDHDYKQETYDAVEEKARDTELRSGPGSIARAEVQKAVAEAARTGESLNDFQAPPSVNAELAAEGEGAQSDPIPVVRTEGTAAPVPAARAAAQPSKASGSNADNKK